VSRILLKPGDAVKPGDEIVSLDQGEPEAELRKLDDGIELRKNARELARLELENTLTDLRGRLKVKALERKSLEFEVARNAKLLEMGAISRDAARSAETRIETIDVEMAQIGESMENAKRDLEIQLRGLDLEISILRRDRDESARRLERATATADRAGVITWVVPVEGVSVARGAEIARIADLGSYRVEATLSDVHSGRIARGLPVRVRVGETLLDGRLTSIRPTVENGIITVEVALDDPSFRELRPQLRADVYIVTERKETVTRLKRGSLVSVDGTSAVFRLAGNRAIRTPVEIGIASFDSCEVVSGLSEGDQVIISDMSNYQDLREVLVR
jgi:HlyD family secretion protein